MKIVFDLNHPAHVHKLKNIIWDLEKKGHDILITASDKDLTYFLLDKYGFDYKKVGSYGSSFMDKLVNIPILDYKMYEITKEFHPDVFVGISSIRAAHVSRLLHRISITLDDTEHAVEGRMLYKPFTNVILTPSSFLSNLGQKQKKFNGYFELAYLHPQFFKPNKSVLEDLGLSKNEHFIILRFVSFTAIHDIGQNGIKNKLLFIKKMEKYGRVLITSEKKLPIDLENYRVSISPEKIHSLLSLADMYVGEGAAMAAEAAILGVPSFYISTLASQMGNFIELENKYHLLSSFSNSNIAEKKIEHLMSGKNVKTQWLIKKENMLNDKINVVKYITDFIETYPIN